MSTLGQEERVLAVYRTLLVSPTLRPVAIAEQLGLTEATVTDAMAQLIVHALVRLSRWTPSVLRTVSPEVALHPIVVEAEAEADLAERHRRLRSLRSEIGTLTEDYPTAREAVTLTQLERLDGRERS